MRPLLFAPVRCYLHTDPLGSISVTTNGSQVVKGTLNYLPFGATRVSTGDVKTDYAFTGQRLETTDGLLYYGAREYDATIGRFIQPDSIIPNLYNPQDLNRYSYVRNNPVRYTDPTGHMLTDDSSGGAVWAVYEPTPDSSQNAGGGGAPPASTGDNQQPSGVVEFIYDKMITNASGGIAAGIKAQLSCLEAYCFKGGGNPQLPALVEFFWLNLPRAELGSIGAGAWDYKLEIRDKFLKEQQVNDWIYDLDVWTNVHFGYVGSAAGFTDGDLLDGAGVAQIISNTLENKPLIGELPSLRSFDPPKDQAAINVGIQLWRDYGLGLKPAQMIHALEANPGIDKRPANRP